MGLPYRNEIDIVTTNGSIYSDKIFSKTEEYKPAFIIRDLNGNKQTIENKNCNHFINMFNYFCGLVDNHDEAQKERDRILSLSEWVEKIRDYWIFLEILLAIASEDVKPGDSMPNKFTRPDMLWSEGNCISKSDRWWSGSDLTLTPQ